MYRTLMSSAQARKHGVGSVKATIVEKDGTSRDVSFEFNVESGRENLVAWLDKKIVAQDVIEDRIVHRVWANGKSNPSYEQRLAAVKGVVARALENTKQR